MRWIRDNAMELVLAFLILYGGIALGGGILLAAQEEGQQDTPIPPPADVTLPEFIVVFEYPTPPTSLNLRTVVRARSEGEAVMRVTLTLVDSFRNQMEFSKLRFIEVAPKLHREKKEEKK